MPHGGVRAGAGRKKGFDALKQHERIREMVAAAHRRYPSRGGSPATPEPGGFEPPGRSARPGRIAPAPRLCSSGYWASSTPITAGVFANESHTGATVAIPSGASFKKTMRSA